MTVDYFHNLDTWSTFLDYHGPMLPLQKRPKNPNERSNLQLTALHLDYKTTAVLYIITFDPLIVLNIFDIHAAAT